jgi:(p)ppGpp synthase/HD superfamily hydrolase
MRRLIVNKQDLDDRFPGLSFIMTKWKVISDAYMFCIAAHSAVGQRRKYTGNQYYEHPISVANRYVNTCKTRNDVDIEMVCAALLHDVVEDTCVEIYEIDSIFGMKVSTIVFWLTDASKKEDGNRATRKKMDRDVLSKSPKCVQTIKYLDLVDNCDSILKYDRKFAKVFLREMYELLSVMKDGDVIVRRHAIDVCEYGFNSIGEIM